MARYKGKREAPRPEKGMPRESNQVLEQQAPVPVQPVRKESENTVSAGIEETRVMPSLQNEDPFEHEPFEQEALMGKRETIGSKLSCFFTSRKGKILTITVCCILAFAVGGAMALRSWVKPPDVSKPSTEDLSHGEQNGNQNDSQEPVPPTDDELYPDDGYDGDMPAVSGDRKEGVYTFLLVGTDKDDGNTDTIMVATYDTLNQDIHIMSIPRDTMINEKWDIKKINSVYSRTGGNINSLANRIQKLVGFKPDFYVKVELSMFVELVDLVGGVDFYVPQDMKYDDPYQDLHINLKEGQQVLDGDKAMQLVRFRRYAEGDIKRVQVQQDFMKALIKECLSLKHWGKIKAYIDLALDNVHTDLDFRSVVWFAANVMGMNDAPMLSMDDVYTCTIPGNYYNEAWSRDTNQMQSYVTIYPNQVVKLVNERFNPYVQKVTTGMLDVMSILENGDIASSVGLKDTSHNAIMAVQRGEAYYDDEGNLVYGTPPVTPETDEFGNYYILDEQGTIIYTDANGTPLDEIGGVESPDAPANIPSITPPSGNTQGNGNETGNGTGTGGTQTGQPLPEDPGVESPDEPSLPEEPADNGGGDSTIDEEIPGWLLPKDD